MNDYENEWAPGEPGDAAKATVTAGAASGAVQIRAEASLGGFVTKNLPIFVTIKAQETTAGPGFHIVFGKSDVGAPTVADMLIQQVDGWKRVQIPSWVTHYRILSETTTAGSVYVYQSGQPS